MTTTALAVSKPQLTPSTLQMIMQLAPTMHTARLFGTRTTEEAAVIMLKGFELGFSITAAFENIHVIDGKPSLSPKGALALIHDCPLLASLSIKDEVDAKGNPFACTVTMKRKNGFEYTTRFSMDDARRADLVKPKSGWEKYPANMLRWRALGYCEDVVFPDVIGGTKRADEYGADLTPDGDVIEGSWVVGSQQASAPTPQPTVSQPKPLTIQDLLAVYNPQQIMAANDGKIPNTPEECQKVLNFLAAPSGTPLTDDVSFGGVLGND